jgi:hypothetical protein
LKLSKLSARQPTLGNLAEVKYFYKNIRAVKLFMNSRLPAWLLLAAVLSTASSCARHGSLQHKTRWYKHHGTGKAVPCPCDH